MKIMQLVHGSDSRIDNVSGKFGGRASLASLVSFMLEKNGGNLAHLQDVSNHQLSPGRLR